jgi:hypothetical protein
MRGETEAEKKAGRQQGADRRGKEQREMRRDEPADADSQRGNEKA